MMQFKSQSLKPFILSKTLSYPGLSLGLFLLALVLIIPTGITAWFDGLPWTGAVETIVLTAVVPFLLILGHRFLSLRLPILFLAALLIVKSVMFFGSPSSGWLVKITPNVTKELISDFMQFQMFDYQERTSKLDPVYPFQASERESWLKSITSKDGYWIKTYATFWNNNASGVLQKPWTEKLSFPLDWFHIGTYEPLEKKWSPKCPSWTCLGELSPIIKIEGSLVLPKGKKFSLIAEGVQEGTFSASNENGKSLNILPAKNIQEAAQEKYQLTKDGRWRISGEFLYGGAKWSLIPVLIEENGDITEEVGRGALWQNREDLSSSLNSVKYYKVLSYILDAGIILFLLAWTNWIICLVTQQKIFNLNLAFFSLTAICASLFIGPFYDYIFKLLGKIDATTVTHLGISTLFAAMGFLIWAYWKNDWRNFQADRIVPSIFLLFAPAILFFFTNKWWSLLEKWQVWTPGDDWSLFQYWAYRIFVEGDWLKAGEGYFQGQPLHRYFVGMYHWLFGQSNFAQHMADVWCVLGAALLLAKLMEKFKISALIIFIACSTYLSINFIGAFRYQIGRGLTDNHGMIFMMLAAWFLVLAREGGINRIFLATLFGVIDFWIRMNHLLAIACLGFLIYEPMKGLSLRWKEYWNRFKLNWVPLAWFWGGGILSMFLICFRNWWLGGNFRPMQNLDNEGHTSYVFEPESLYVILAGQTWPSFPDIAGFIITFGVLVALFTLAWRPKYIHNFPLSLSLSIVGLLLPFAIFKVVGYAPRFSISLLPLTIWTLAFLFNNLIENYKFPKLNKEGRI